MIQWNHKEGFEFDTAKVLANFKIFSYYSTDIYNTTTQLCCEQNIVARKTSSSQCCGNGVYESDSETCCIEANAGFPGLGRQCCRSTQGGVVAYDPEQDTCCSWRQYGKNWFWL